MLILPAIGLFVKIAIVPILQNSPDDDVSLQIWKLCSFKLLPLSEGCIQNVMRYHGCDSITCFIPDIANSARWFVHLFHVYFQPWDKHFKVPSSLTVTQWALQHCKNDTGINIIPKQRDSFVYFLNNSTFVNLPAIWGSLF